MGQAVSQAGRKLLAVVVLMLAAYLLFKVLLGVAMAVAWMAVVVLAIVAVVSALRVL